MYKKDIRNSLFLSGVCCCVCTYCVLLFVSSAPPGGKRPLCSPIRPPSTPRVKAAPLQPPTTPRADVAPAQAAGDGPTPAAPAWRAALGVAAGQPDVVHVVNDESVAAEAEVVETTSGDAAAWGQDGWSTWTYNQSYDQSYGLSHDQGHHQEWRWGQ